MAEGESIRSAEQAALVEHAEEHWAKLAEAEQRVLEQARAAVQVLVDLVPEASLIVGTAHQVTVAARLGDRAMSWEVDLARLAQLAATGGRLLAAEPVKEPSFRQWVTVDSVES